MLPLAAAMELPSPETTATIARTPSPFRFEALPPLPETPDELMAPVSFSPQAAADALRRLSILEEEEPIRDDSGNRPTARPQTPRSATDPTILSTGSSASTPIITTPAQSPLPPRQRSPYSRPHMRSTSGSSSSSLLPVASSSLSAAAPPMMRAHSSPASTSSASFRSTSPLRSPGRARSPFRYGSNGDEMALPSSLSPFSVVSEHIPEDSELDITPRTGRTMIASVSPMPTFNLAHSNTFPRRRRPASPLHGSSITGISITSSPRPVTPSSSASQSLTSSPLLNAAKFNEAFPSDLNYSRSFSSSSVPSTPTSTRSRSPSISSLETIPDSPDAEMKAVEEDIIARQRATADGEDGMEGSKKESFRRSSFDMPQPRIGFGFGGRDKRKRWSVCGAERRGDINLDTIWEV